MLEYKLTPEQRLLNAIYNENIAIPPSSCLDRYNKAELKIIMHDWLRIFNGVSQNYYDRINNKVNADELIAKDMMFYIKQLSNDSQRLGNTRKIWGKINAG